MRSNVLEPKAEALPNYIDRPSAWVGRELANQHDQWLYTLADQDVADLEQAAGHYLDSGRDIGEMTKSDFSLDHFGHHLVKLREKLLQGIGVELIRGLPANGYSQKTAAAIFCGIGAHLGSARSQNAGGHILGHVRDIGADVPDPNARIYQTSARQTFHTDSTDVVGLMCLKSAKSGGQSLLVSAETLFNEMQRKRPDLVPQLFDIVATDRRGEIPPGEKAYFEIPVLSWYRELLTVQYQRQYIDSAQRFSDAPKLTNEQIEALDYFDALANDPELHMVMQLQPGDMQFVYNHSQLHDREAFVDWPEPENRRHLLRLWLSLEGDRPLPTCFQSRYGSVEPGNRGGIITEQTHLHAPLD
ncbi:MAG: TauD/TfdA family dioxygenase [Gammaproteobacteria bacterium]|nr:TauD/TfdA family dioxygenase [Gammaproteobacteria bacterium]